jgi:putative membrane protein
MKTAWVTVLLVAMGGAAAVAQSHGDKEFMEKASQGNVAEVELGKLALKKSTNPEVRAFAQRMIKDHQTLGKKMAPLMAQAGVQPSISLNTEHQHLFNKLNGLSGAEFDKEYAKAMAEDHHEDLKEFQDEVGSTQVPAIKTTVTSGEKIIAEHTQMADDLAHKLGASTGS